MALRALQGPTGGGSPVGGTGTTNTIPRWTGPSTLGDSGLIDNGTAIYTTTRNVGIGTASPGGRLDVANAGNVIVRAQNTASNSDAQFNAVNTFGTATFGINNVGGYALTASAIPFLFYTNNTERARIDSAGNFGIGTGAATTTPAATGSLVIGQNNVSQQWAARIYGGNDANRAPVLSLFRAGNTEGIIAEIKNGAVGALALGITGGVANFNDATLSAACQVQITSTLMDISGASYGLKLPATPGNADTQTLDAYRENTFTPTIQGGTTAGVGTYTSQVGTFTIIGRCLFFNVEIAWSAHTGTGPVQLAGLPVAAAQLATFGLDSNYAAAGYLRMSAGNTFAQINTINVPATGNYRVSGCYFIA